MATIVSWSGKALPSVDLRERAIVQLCDAAEIVLHFRNQMNKFDRLIGVPPLTQQNMLHSACPHSRNTMDDGRSVPD